MTSGTAMAAAWWSALDGWGAWAFRAGWQVAVLCAVVAAVLWLFGRRLSPGWRFGLWGLVLVRLAVPAVVEVGWVAETRREEPRTAVAPGDESPGLAAVAVDESAGGAGAVDAAPVEPIRAPAPVVVPAGSAVRAVPNSQARKVDWVPVRRWVGVIWLTGVVVLGARVLASSVRLSRAVRRMRRVDDPGVIRAMRDAAGELGLRCVPGVRELPGPGAPVLVGFVRPVVLLPPAVVGAMGEDELRLIVLHELAHVRRRDVLINWLTTAVCVAHWVNPVAWVVAWRMRVERELACDEMVLSAAVRRAGPGADGGRAYARVILKLVEALSGAASRPAPGGGGAVGILEGKAQIQRRLVMIARYDTRTNTRRWPVLAGTLALMVGGAALCGGAKPKDAEAGAQPPPRQAPPAGAPRGGYGGGYAPGGFRDAGMGVAPGFAPAAPAPISDAEQKANDELEQTLRKPIPEVNFNGQALSDVIDFFRDVTNADIVVPWPVLETAGISRDHPVTFRLKGAKPASDVLALMFRSMGDALSYKIEKGAVVVGLGGGLAGGPIPGIGAPPREAVTLVTKVYDLNDLLGAPVTAPPGLEGGIPGAADPAAGGFAAPPLAAGAAVAQEVVALVTRTVEPTSWREAGGSDGSITVFRNKLVVKNTEAVHREITELLRMLRDKPEGKKTAPVQH